MKVTCWTDWEDSRFEDLPQELLNEAKKMVISEIQERGYKFTGDYHQNGDYGVPVIDDKYLAKYSQRHWGWLMAKAYPDEIDDSDGYGYIVWAWNKPNGVEMVVPEGGLNMTFYIGESGSSGRQFDNIEDFIQAIRDLADTYEANGEDWFEIEVVSD